MTKRTAVRGPNKYPEPRTEAQLAALQSPCRYLGREFYEGDTICYRGDEWRCSAGNWIETGEKC